MTIQSDETLLLRRYAENHRFNSFLVVTSAYHSRRAFWTLRRAFANSGIVVGIDAVPAGLRQTPPAGHVVARVRLGASNF